MTTMSPAYKAVHAQSGETLTSAKTSKRRSLTSALGRWGAWLLFLGIPFQFGILAFLIYLWASQEDIKKDSVPASALWRRLAFRGWDLAGRYPLNAGHESRSRSSYGFSHQPGRRHPVGEGKYAMERSV